MEKTIVGKRWIAMILILSMVFGGSVTTIYGEDTASAPESNEWVEIAEVDLIGWASQTGGMTLADRAQMYSMVEAQSVTDYEGAKAALVEGAVNWESSIDISEYKIPYAEVAALYYEMCYENPQLFYLKTACSYSYDGTYIISINPKYNSNFTEANVEVYESTIDAIVDSIPQGMSDEDTVLALHDYLVSHCAYDTTYSNYDAYSALVWGNTVCQGYALAYSDLLNRFGIENKYVSSENMNHAWNLVNVDGEWYHVDATWDDPLYGGEDLLGYVGHANFLRSDDGITETEHYDWETTITCTNTKYDGYYWSDYTSAVIYKDEITRYVMLEGVLYEMVGESMSSISNSAKDIWYVWESNNSYWGSGYGKLVLNQNVLYYNSSDTIYAYNLKTGEESVYYTYTGDNGYIYGLAESIDESELQLEIRTSPNAGAVETVSVEIVEEIIPFEIFSQPTSQIVDENEYATFTVGATGEGLSYQWQYSQNGNVWYNSGMTGAKTASLTVQGLAKRDGQMYRCIITDAEGNQLVSAVVTLTVNIYGITKQPESQTVNENEYAIFTVEATGEGLSYQWQYSQSGSMWYNSGMDGAKTASLMVQGLSKRDGQMYRCVITDANGNEYISDVVTLTVNACGITKQPESQIVNENEYVTFTVEATGDGLSYQWQYSQSGNMWYNSGMTGAKTESLVVQGLSKRDGQMYRCVITDANGNEYISDVVTLTVNAYGITKQPESQTVNENEYAIFTVEAIGESLSYQWQYSQSGNMWYNSGMAGAKTASLTVQGLAKRDGQMYRCVVTDADGNEYISDVVTLTVGAYGITKQPESQTVNENEYATFTVEAIGDGLSYQWQYSQSGNMWYNSGMDGAKTASLMVQGLAKRDGQMYRCVVTDKNGNQMISKEVILSVE